MRSVSIKPGCYLSRSIYSGDYGSEIFVCRLYEKESPYGDNWRTHATVCWSKDSEKIRDTFVGHHVRINYKNVDRFFSATSNQIFLYQLSIIGFYKL